jgi:hypothetical protein
MLFTIYDDAVALLGDTGVKHISSAFIQIDVEGCQQPVGWLDQLDPQWNVTQCALDEVNLIINFSYYTLLLYSKLASLSSSGYLSSAKDYNILDNLTELYYNIQVIIYSPWTYN